MTESLKIHMLYINNRDPPYDISSRSLELKERIAFETSETGSWRGKGGGGSGTVSGKTDKNTQTDKI